MPGDLCTAPRIISLSPLSLATDVTDATHGASGLWLGTRTGPGGTAIFVTRIGFKHNPSYFAFPIVSTTRYYHGWQESRKRIYCWIYWGVSRSPEIWSEVHLQPQQLSRKTIQFHSTCWLHEILTGTVSTMWLYVCAGDCAIYCKTFNIACIRYNLLHKPKYWTIILPV